MKASADSLAAASGLESQVALFDAKADAMFTKLLWMLGVNMALTLLVVGPVLRLGGLR